MCWPPFPPRFAGDHCPREAIVESATRYGPMLHLAHDRYLGHALQAYGEYSEAEVDLWRALLSTIAPRVVVDGGANIGIHTLALAQAAPHTLIIAVEPLWRIYSLLAANLVRNGADHVYPIHAALGATAGTLAVPSLDYARPDNYGGVSLADPPDGAADWRAVALHVPQIRLDDLLPAVDFIKLDVEGMEAAVLRGATRLIRECEPVLYCEANPGPAQGPLLALLHDLGYTTWWHTPPHHREPNWRGVPVAEGDREVVSINVIALPPRWRHLADGWPPPIGATTWTP